MGQVGMTPELNNWVLLTRAAELKGYNPKALHEKCRDGTWIEYTEETSGLPEAVWRKAPDGRKMVSLTKFDQWVEPHGPH